MAPVKVAVIGAGSIGKRHAANLDRLGAEVQLIPWRAFSPDRLRAEPGLGAVVIATATQIRLDLIAQCAEAGLPFYAEKPLAWTPEDAAAIHEVAGPVAGRCMVGFMMRYHPIMRDLARRDLSQVYSFSFEIGHDVRQWRANWRFADSYAARPEGGGVLLDLSHELDMALALFPALELGRCDSLGHARFPNVDFATTAQLAAPGGPMGQVEMDYLSPVSTRRAVLRGLDARIEIDFLRPAMSMIGPDGADETSYDFDRNDMFLDAMRDFLALVRDDAASDNPLLPRLDRMRRSTELIAAAWSARHMAGTVDIDMG